MQTKHFLILLLSLFLCAVGLRRASQASEPLWQDVSEVAERSGAQRLIEPTEYRLVRADFEQLRTVLAEAPSRAAGAEALITTLPLAEGGFGRFQVTNAPIMEPELAARYPQLQTFTAQGIDDPTATARLDITPQGFHAIIQSADGTTYIDPYQTNDTTHYISYDTRNMDMPDLRISERVSSSIVRQLTQPSTVNQSVGNVQRQFQLALSATGEYADFICTQGGVDCSTTAAKRASAMAALTTGINRVTQIYERDLSISFILVNSTDQLVFTDSTADPYTNGNDLGAIQDDYPDTFAAVLDSAAYDVGHIVSAAQFGGEAGTFQCSGSHRNKANGVSGLALATGDPFWVAFVAHEMGHQFSARHSFNAITSGFCLGSGPFAAWDSQAAFEPASGSTIMSYVGTCGDQDLQTTTDAMFNAGAYNEIIAHVTTGGGASCAEEIPLGNTPPTVEAGNNQTIPAETPFQLTATIQDAEQANSALTTSWEQFTLGAGWTFASIMPNSDQQDNQTRPIFRVNLPSSSPTRMFPKYESILDGSYSNTGEDLPSIAQTLTFRATVRDNVIGSGGVASDDMQITVATNSGPFRVTSPASPASHMGTTRIPITWDVANTDQPPVSCATVDIRFSTDGGQTFPSFMATNVPNNGAAEGRLPNMATTQGRIQVICHGNVFFDINKADLTVTPDPSFDKAVFIPIVVR